MTVRAHRQKAIPLPQFISRGASALTVSDIETFHRHAPALRRKLRTIRAAGHEGLHEEAQALLDYTLAACRGGAHPFKPRAMFDGIFALHYLLKGVDAIPDSVPGIGYEDDRIIVHHVFTRHRETLQAYRPAV
jgi:uncharacterized membrane protein YkvA (DUF1232 family)